MDSLIKTHSVRLKGFAISHTIIDMNILFLILLFSCPILTFPLGKVLIGSSSLALSKQSNQLPWHSIRVLRHEIALFSQNKHPGDHVVSAFKDQFLAIDCEMVGTRNNTKSALARVSIVER